MYHEFNKQKRHYLNYKHNRDIEIKLGIRIYRTKKPAAASDRAHTAELWFYFNFQLIAHRYFNRVII